MEVDPGLDEGGGGDIWIGAHDGFGRWDSGGASNLSRVSRAIGWIRDNNAERMRISGLARFPA